MAQAQRGRGQIPRGRRTGGLWGECILCSCAASSLWMLSHVQQGPRAPQQTPLGRRTPNHQPPPPEPLGRRLLSTCHQLSCLSGVFCMAEAKFTKQKYQLSNPTAHDSLGEHLRASIFQLGKLKPTPGTSSTAPPPHLPAGLPAGRSGLSPDRARQGRGPAAQSCPAAGTESWSTHPWMPAGF